MFQCGHCGQELKIEGQIRREEACPSCGGYLHCCLNCRFFADGISRRCSEPQAEEVRDRSAANFCGFFVLGRGGASFASLHSDAKAEEAKARFEALFRKEPKGGMIPS